VPCATLDSHKALVNPVKEGQPVSVSDFGIPESSVKKLRRVREAIIERCTNPKCKAYHRYGGRGITICDEWRCSSRAFIKWSISNGWQPGLEIDRRDNNAGYNPDNCRCVTRKVNMNNMEATLFIEAFGDRKTISEWLEEARCVVERRTLYYRIYRYGWDAERALAEPSIRRLITAFGEKKLLKHWSIDRRCVVGDELLAERLKNGWQPEAAITTPAYRRNVCRSQQQHLLS
jgi:hypothetical protein